MERRKDLGKSFKAHVVAFDGLNVVAARKAAVAVHYEGDVLWDRALTERVDEEGFELEGGPFEGR